MHKSVSVSRQDTFDTGPAHLDKRGSIRRGDVELPVVDDIQSKQHISEHAHDHYGISSHPPSSKDRLSPLRDRGLTESAKSEQKAPDRASSPRYVDHNKLFPEPPVNTNRGSTKSVLREPECATFYKDPRRKRNSPRLTDKNIESDLKQENKVESSVEQTFVEEKSPFHVNKDNTNRNDDSKKLTQPGSSSTVIQTQAQESHQSDTLTFLESPSQSSKSSIVGGEGSQKDRSFSQRGLKQKEYQSSSDTKKGHYQQKSDNSTADTRAPRSEKEQKSQEPHQKQDQQQPQFQPQEQQENKANTTKAGKHSQHTAQKSDNALKDTATLSPHTSTDTSSLLITTDPPLPHQPSTVLLSAHKGSAPPQDHTHEANNPSPRTLDIPRDRKQTAKVAPQSVTKINNLKNKKESVQETQQTDQNAPAEDNFLRLQPQGQATKTTMAQTKENAMDSLTQVTAERDQLLKNERTYKKRILQLEEEVKVTVKQSQELSAENRLLSTKLEAIETKVYGGSLELKELRREKQDLVTQVARTTGEKQEMDAENERLRSKLAEADSKTRQWDALYVENNKLKTKQAELERKIVELENEKMKLKNNVRTAESTQLDKLAAVQNENKKLEAELINLQTKNNSMERKVERMETEYKELDERLNQKKTELDELMIAMKTETNTELELKEVNQELEFAKNKMEDFRKDLNETNRRYEVLEKEKDSVKNSLRLKESECKGLKATLEEKDTQTGELKRQVDTAKRNIKRLEDDLEDTKQVEKDVINMKARVRSLKNEIEDSLSANHKMKQEKTEARLEADRLNRELAATLEALSEARRYIKKLEGERSSRDKMEEELKLRKQREQELEHQTYEMNSRNEQLRTRIHILEDEKEDILKRDVNETHTVNRKLQEENKKLRQLMVERNMEMAQRQSEGHVLKDRVEYLERKQNDADIKVQQLKGWVEDVYTYTPAQQASSQHPNPTLALPPVRAKAARKSKPNAGEGAGLRRKRGQNLSQQQRQHQLNRSWEDLQRLKTEPDESIRTTPGLPGMSDTKVHYDPPQGNPGYFDLYKSKMKLIRERKW